MSDLVSRRGFFGALAGLPLAATVQPKATQLVEQGTLLGVTDFTTGKAVTYHVWIDGRAVAEASFPIGAHWHRTEASTRSFLVDGA